MDRKQYDHEFKVAAVKAVTERGVSIAQAARDLVLNPNTLARWVKNLAPGLAHAFPAQGQMRFEQSEIERLQREVTDLKAERDLLKKTVAYFARASI